MKGTMFKRLCTTGLALALIVSMFTITGFATEEFLVTAAQMDTGFTLTFSEVPTGVSSDSVEVINTATGVSESVTVAVDENDSTKYVVTLIDKKNIAKSLEEGAVYAIKLGAGITNASGTDLSNPILYEKVNYIKYLVNDDFNDDEDFIEYNGKYVPDGYCITESSISATRHKGGTELRLSNNMPATHAGLVLNFDKL